MHRSLLTLLTLATVTYSLPVSAASYYDSRQVEPQEESVSQLPLLQPGSHLDILSAGDGRHTCRLTEDDGPTVAVGKTSGHTCHLSLTVPQDGRAHHYYLSFYNQETYSSYLRALVRYI
jgi:hypothetical protein